MDEWIKKYFKNEWLDFEGNLDLKNLTPYHTSSSLHILEERYKIEGETYRVLYAIGCENDTPLIEILKK